MSIPDYVIYRSKRRTVRLTLRTNGTFAVYCPMKYPKKDIEALIEKHSASLISKMQARSDELFTVVNGCETLPLLGKRYPLTFGSVKYFTFDGEKFISPVTEREAVRELYREYLRATLKSMLPPMADDISSRFGLHYNGITVKAIFSKYGSCSSKKHLNFTLALAAFDTEFIRYVVSHELCHTVHMDHSTKFYKLLDKVCPEHRSIKENGRKQRSVILKAILYRPA